MSKSSKSCSMSRLMSVRFVLALPFLATGAPMTGAATRLFQQPHTLNGHAAIDRFAHVVDGEQRNLYGGQRFHFHARLAVCLGCRPAVDGVALGLDGKVNG